MYEKVRHKGVEPVLSATPLLEAQRDLLTAAGREDMFDVVDPFLIFIADGSRAHFHADEVRDVHVRLFDENSKSKGPGVWANMPKTMHGTLDAVQQW